MVSSMKTFMPINEKLLKEIGVKKSGLRRRLLAALYEEANYICKSPRRIQKQDKNSIKCCSATTATSNALFNVPSLKAWLEKLNLADLYQDFVDSGYDDMEHNLALMNSDWPITEDILLNELKVLKPGYRHRILSKLKEDCLGFESFKKSTVGFSRVKKDEEILIERSSTNSACGMCSLM